ncbi:MAG: ABC transporter permease subunit [Zoogloea sp.]|uniref:ABC transporter permease subunit n=1 Tax=Zoogloea sp. TaxID=49181 RepID=UPI0026067F87|nr:ABC transporter permease subunit [Zoogloea sp.]MDD2990098.1 ABC transporter permease subunit [Zoogloea sp.]
MKHPARLAWQALLLLALLVLGGLLVTTTAGHLQERGIRSGFDFLLEPAGFALGESLLPFDSGDSTLRAFAAGLLNTLRVALPGALLAVVVGVVVGFGRLGDNPLVRALAGVFVNGVRNVPLLLHLLAWYFILTDLLPAADAALRLAPGVFLSKSGLALPWWGEAGWELPEPAGFGIDGGARLTPEYLALLIGLSTYSAAYIAETLRGAVQALPPGQRLSALALGMTPRQAFVLVLLPQAWRAALPPVTSQLLNLFKNASLAVAIGYPDLVSVAGTSLNQTGRAIECLLIVIGVYLLLSLLAAALSHRLERRSLRGMAP